MDPVPFCSLLLHDFSFREIEAYSFFCIYFFDTFCTHFPSCVYLPFFVFSFKYSISILLIMDALGYVTKYTKTYTMTF